MQKMSAKAKVKLISSEMKFCGAQPRATGKSSMQQKLKNY